MAITTHPSWDISVSGRDGQLILSVEVKQKSGASPDWAAQFRRNMLAHGIFDRTPYFLMAFPDKFYLWMNADTKPDDCMPDYAVDAKPVINPYLERTGLSADSISGQSLELIVSSWLSKLIYSRQSSETFNDTQKWLIESGLYNALAGGELKQVALA